MSGINSRVDIGKYARQTINENSKNLIENGIPKDF